MGGSCANLQSLLVLLPMQLVLVSQHFYVEYFSRLLGTARSQRLDDHFIRRRAHDKGVENLALGREAHVLCCQWGLLTLVEAGLRNRDFGRWSGTIDGPGTRAIDAFAVYFHPRSDAFEYMHLLGIQFAAVGQRKVK